MNEIERHIPEAAWLVQYAQDYYRAAARSANATHEHIEEVIAEQFPDMPADMLNAQKVLRAAGIN